MKEYYYIGQNNRQVGPLSIDELRTQINLNTMVWTEGMTNWAPASTVPELVSLLNSQANVPPQQPPYGQYQQNYWQPSYGQQPDMGPKPDNYLVWAILSIVFCCWPLGIVAVVYAAKVNSLWSEGRYEESRQASNNAKKYTLISVIAALVLAIIYAILIASGAFDDVFKIPTH